MGVGVQGEPSGEVAQHGGDGFDIHAVLEGEGGKGVPEVMEANLGNPIFDTVSELCVEDQRLAFYEGLRLGVTLMMELAEK